MTTLWDIFPADHFDEGLAAGLIRRQEHPTLPLAILNYTQEAAARGEWNECTRACRGLIYHVDTYEVVARPFPKFFNHGEPHAPVVHLDERAVVTDKIDGSLGIVYPLVGGRCPECGGEYAHVSYETYGIPDGWACTTLGGCSLGFVPRYAVATRGSFTSPQALHATEILRTRRYSDWGPPSHCTTLVEIVYPGNRIVVDYEGLDDLVYLATLRISDGAVESWVWPGPFAAGFAFDTLADALAAEPRPNAEGFVVYLPDRNDRVKIKQDDYVALHRILTGTNARDVYEFAAVRACREAVLRSCENPDDEGKHWASFVGLDPVRVEQIFAAGEDWLVADGVPEEFYGWARSVADACEEHAGQTIMQTIQVARAAAELADREERFRYVAEHSPDGMATEAMRLACGGGRPELDRVVTRAWRLACPAPTAPFARTEAVA